MEGKKTYTKLEAASQKHILRFLQDKATKNHHAHFEKHPEIFGSSASGHREKCERFFRDTKRRVVPDPVKFKELLAKHGMTPKKPRKTKKLAKRHDSDDDDNDDDDDNNSKNYSECGEDEEEEDCAFVGSPNPKQKQPPPQKKSAKKNVASNRKNGK
jgi:hypothetical protein